MSQNNKEVPKKKETVSDEIEFPVWTSVVIVLAVSGFIVTLAVIFAPIVRYNSVQAEFFRQIESQASLGALRSAEDIEMIRLGVAREKNSEKLRTDNLKGLLTEYLVSITKEKEARSELWSRLQRESGKEKILDRMPDKENRAEKVRTAQDLVRITTSEKPFSILPEGDQVTAVELENSIKLGDREASLTRLRVLTASLGKEISSLKTKIETNWRWTIVSAFLGGGGILVTMLVFMFSRRVALARDFRKLRRDLTGFSQGPSEERR